MSPRNVRIILGLLAALLAAYALSRVLGGRDGRIQSAGIDVGGAVDSGTSLIRVRKPGGSDSIRLERVGDAWRVNGYPADTGEVRSLIAALDTATALELVSRSPANHPRLGVTEEAGHLVAFGGADPPALSILIGNSGRGGRYVRSPDAPEVYLLPGNGGQLLTRDADSWRDRVIAALDTSLVREVVIRRGAEALVLSRPDSVWVLDGEAADSSRVRSLLGGLTRLTAMRFPPDSVAVRADFDAPEAVLEAYDEAGASAPAAAPLASLLFVKEEEGSNYLVRRADRPVVYLLAEWSVNRLLPTPEELDGE
ncbi:MAG: DUF4340 domain-containing protein [Gemmatimonadota bacterium]